MITFFLLKSIKSPNLDDSELIKQTYFLNLNCKKTMNLGIKDMKGSLILKTNNYSRHC